MTDIDKAWAYLRQTKTAGANLKKWPPTDKNSYWYKAGVELGVITTGPPPPPPPPPPTGSLGSALRAAFPPITGLTLIDDTGKPPRSQGPFDTSGHKHYRNVNRVGGNKDGYKASGSGATDIVYELCDAHSMVRPDPSQPDGDHNSVNAFSLMNGCRRIRILGGEAYDLGTSKFSHGIYAGECHELLIAAWLAHDVGCKALQFFPGPTEAVVTNVTVGWTRFNKDAVIGQGGSQVSIYNSIIYGNVRGDIKLVNCCVPPEFNIEPSVVQVGTIRESAGRESAGFAQGSYKPTNPKLLGGGDAGWVPEHDYAGTAYTRPTIGAVAA